KLATANTTEIIGAPAGESPFCDHCGLPLGRLDYRRDDEGHTGQFCCYGCYIGWQAARGGGDDVAVVGFLIRLGVGAFLAMNIMLFSLLLYTGALDGIDLWLKPYVHGLLWGLATPVLIILGGPFFREAVTGFADGRLASSMLVVIGTSAAYVYSAIVTWQGGDRVYFDAVALILVLFTLGRYLEAEGRARAARSLRPFLDAEKQSVRCLKDGDEVTLPLAEVTPDMRIRIEPGERIPVDGKVVDGVSTAEESSLTGEPWPAEKKPGADVLAGSTNGDGALIVEAGAAGLDSGWITICRDVRKALSQPTRLQRLADKTAQVFVPLVIAIAAMTIWLNGQDGAIDAALMSGLAVLVVACPCALGLASPLATTMAVGRLAEAGVTLRHGLALETLAGVRTMVLDKTGTLTAGRIQCREAIDIDAALGDGLRRAASLAVHSKHPISKAVCRTASERGVNGAIIADVEIIPGMGIRGSVDGEAVMMGNARWLEGEGVKLSDALCEQMAAAAEQGCMLALVAWRHAARCLLTFEDVKHPDAETLIKTLHNDGMRTVVLSGDGMLQTERFCRSIGIDRWSAEMTPEGKREALKRIARNEGPLAMVGDGANDTLALIRAEVGIAVGNGTDLARETADIVLPPTGIAALPDLLRLARATKKTIATNLIWAFSYNAIAIGLAVTGLLQPIIAAVLMAGSSLVVVANTMMRLAPEDQVVDLERPSPGQSPKRQSVTT
ncbi:MAG: cation-translocating P-type ATPase, partial [Pseudomonadota bacterium]